HGLVGHAVEYDRAGRDARDLDHVAAAVAFAAAGHAQRPEAGRVALHVAARELDGLPGEVAVGFADSGVTLAAADVEADLLPRRQPRHVARPLDAPVDVLLVADHRGANVACLHGVGAVAPVQRHRAAVRREDHLVGVGPLVRHVARPAGPVVVDQLVGHPGLVDRVDADE